MGVFPLRYVEEIETIYDSLSLGATSTLELQVQFLGATTTLFNTDDNIENNPYFGTLFGYVRDLFGLVVYMTFLWYLAMRTKSLFRTA